MPRKQRLPSLHLDSLFTWRLINFCFLQFTTLVKSKILSSHLKKIGNDFHWIYSLDMLYKDRWNSEGNFGVKKMLLIYFCHLVWDLIVRSSFLTSKQWKYPAFNIRWVLVLSSFCHWVKAAINQVFVFVSDQLWCNPVLLKHQVLSTSWLRKKNLVVKTWKCASHFISDAFYFWCIVIKITTLVCTMLRFLSFYRLNIFL